MAIQNFLKKYKIEFFIILFILVTSCAWSIKPKISPVKPGMIPEYSSNQSVRVVNVSSTGTVRVQDTGWEINLKETTDVAVGLIKTELSKRGFQIQDNANKVLQVIIGDVQSSLTFRGFTAHKCTMDLRVKPGNGYFKQYQEYNVGLLPTNCDFAITKAVSAMLSDEDIINYLKND